MNYRPQEIKAGLVVFISIILLVVLLVLISGIELGSSKKQYLAQFSYTSGLEIGSVVRFGGMEVGRVNDMYFSDEDDSRIEFVLEMDRDIPVKTNSRAIVTSIGIMGEYHVSISTGSPDSALLPEGSMLVCKDVPPIMQVVEPINDVAEKLGETLEAVKQLLGTENRDEVRSILVNLNGLLHENQKSISMLVNNLNTGVADLSKVSARLDRMLDSNEENISNSMQLLEEALTQTKGMMNNMNRMVNDLDTAVLQKGDNLEEIIDNLNQATSHLEEFSRQIKQQPWSLIRKSAPSERKID